MNEEIKQKKIFLKIFQQKKAAAEDKLYMHMA